MEKPIVIFGASGAGRKISEVIDKLNKEIEFFVDNDSNKWNTLFCGKVVKSPQSLLLHDYTIVMGSTHVEEIENQLEEMGLINNLVYGDCFKLEYIIKSIKEFQAMPVGINSAVSPEVIIDISTGPPMCGVWTWSFQQAEMLYKRNHKVAFFYSNDRDNIPKNVAAHTYIFDFPEKGYIETIMDMARIVIDNLPCTVIINFQGEMMYAAIAAKILYPNDINIISIIHNDDRDVCYKNKLIAEYIDKIVAVSIDIKNKMIMDYGISCEKLFYKETPIFYNKKFIKQYNINASQPIVIGYAARLEIYQKRADLLIPFINILDENKCNYQLLIAGDGTFHKKLEEYVNGRKDNSVRLLGRIERENMEEFWEKCDIFISLSEFEGSSISLLEAMSKGVVPVVTEVSGTNEFIINGENGFVYPIGNIESIGKRIIKLDNNRSALIKLGDCAKKVVRMKCNPDDYINFIEQLL
ncbi:glycosyltransferase [Anaerocolumna sedimenticola]|uniref:Glycosyltransferase n=1 Tax=Anaerocolumna sedimenticola TaxID=2696063 RepID=A0A6P1THR4_9FIRM|nr:glycosyltransferase [Anaerocolumna sedimenticola]QHQ60684.1 glycosyltransferase [Anaerocolumna sedimenticola]